MRKLRQTLSLLKFASGARYPTIGPAKVTWDVTHRCNLRCRHCHLWQIKEHDDLSTEEGKRLIKDIGRLGSLHLSFSGGEPFLRKDMCELISYAVEHGLTTGVNTNGTLLGSAERAREVCSAGLGAAFVSLDGPDPETHNALRGNPRAFDLVLRTIDSLVEQRTGSTPRVFINTTVTRDNVENLEKILELGREHGVDGMTMSVIQNIDKYAPEADTEFEGDSAGGLGERLISLATASKGLIPHSQEYLRHFQTYLEAPEKLYSIRCAAGYAMASVLPNGDVHPCPVPFASMGNLREKTFSEIWFSEEANRIRDRIQANQHPICWFDCIAPLNVFLHHLRKLSLRGAFHRETLVHILRKVAR